MESQPIPARQVGVELYHGFGDGLFACPLISRLSAHHNSPIGVITAPHCVDAFQNLSFIDEIITHTTMGAGPNKLKSLGYKHIYQLTPNLHFANFQSRDPNHSLIDTIRNIGQLYQINDLDQRPLFNPNSHELELAKTINSTKPLLFIESAYYSQQSWAQQHHFLTIIRKFGHSHRICWLSHVGCPNDNYSMSNYSRRVLITALRHCQLFFSVGSGFFCGMLATTTELQPKTVCLWTDHLYRYRQRLRELGWVRDITWLDSEPDLDKYLINA